MTPLPKNVYTDKIDDIINEQDTGHRTTKIKSVDLKSSTYIEFDGAKNDKNLKFKVGDHVRMLKFKTCLQKCNLQISRKKFL